MVTKLDKKEQEEFFKEIEKFFDFGEDVLTVIESTEENHQISFDLASPVIEQVNESAEIIADIYLSFIKNNEKSTAEEISQYEKAI